MSAPVVPVNVQVPSDATAPVLADLTVHAIRVAHVWRRDVERLPVDDWYVPGIYVLLAAGITPEAYVGKAVDLRGRLLQHRSKPKLDWQRAIAIKRDTSHGFNSDETTPAGNTIMGVTTLATTVPLSVGDRRMTVPLFTLHECATYLQTPLSTLHAWARPKGEAPLVTVLPSAGRQATVPFVGFAEAFVLGALRQAGLPMQRIRPAVKKLSDEIGLDHALASRRVYTDGAELIFDYASSSDDEELLTVVRTGQEHFAEVIREYLQRITYGDDGWATRLRLPAYSSADVTVDPSEAFGQPLVVHGGARVEDLVDRFRAGDGFADIAADFDVPDVEVEDVIRVALKLPA